jgi:hypothetical protein
MRRKENAMRDLRGLNEPGKIDSGKTRKIIGAAIVAASLCGAGAYAYHAGTFTQPTKVAQAVTDSDLPS